MLGGTPCILKDAPSGLLGPSPSVRLYGKAWVLFDLKFQYVIFSSVKAGKAESVRQWNDQITVERETAPSATCRRTLYYMRGGKGILFSTADPCY